MGVGVVDSQLNHSFQSAMEGVIPLDSLTYPTAEGVLDGFSLDEIIRDGAKMR